MSLVDLLIFVAIAVIVVSVIWWLLQQVGLDPMIKRIITIALVVIVAVIAILFLMRLGGMGSSIRLGALGLVYFA